MANPELDGVNFTIKIADPDDNVLPIVKEAIEASPYRKMLPSDEELLGAISHFLGQPHRIILLLCYEEEPVGILVGLIGNEHPLINGKKVATELVWYVKPAFRGKYSCRLLDAYEHWAKVICGCDIIHVANFGNSKELDRLYSYRGFAPVEKSFIKMINKD
jgi:hypothetical protein